MCAPENSSANLPQLTWARQRVGRQVMCLHAQAAPLASTTSAVQPRQGGSHLVWPALQLLTGEEQSPQQASLHRLTLQRGRRAQLATERTPVRSPGHRQRGRALAQS